MRRMKTKRRVLVPTMTRPQKIPSASGFILSSSQRCSSRTVVKKARRPLGPIDLPRIRIDEHPCSAGLGEPYVIGTTEGRWGMVMLVSLYTIGGLLCDALQKHAERQRLLVGYRCHALVLARAVISFSKTSRAPVRQVVMMISPEGQGEPQMELLEEFCVQS